LKYFDPSGNVPVETIADIASISWSFKELVKNPSWANAGFLLWDVGATFVPYAPGSYVAKGLKAAGKADDAIDATKASKGMGKLATSGNYRTLYLEKFPGLPKGWQVHHTLPQKYESILSKAGINIHEVKYLRGIDPKIHTKITNEWGKMGKRFRKNSYS
jgi:hypothetical protein